jgi:hypothetical protein
LIEETLEALYDLVKAGTALYIADLWGWARFVSLQNHDNLIYREEERGMIANLYGGMWWTPFFGQKRPPSLDRAAALKMKESQCQKYARVTRPA